MQNNKRIIVFFFLFLLIAAMLAAPKIVEGFGMCRDNPAVRKQNKRGSNCFGWCPQENLYKTDAQGTNCNMYRWGYCTGNKSLPKIDAEGSNCTITEETKDLYCPDNMAVKRMVEDGMDANCFGWCPKNAYQTRDVYNWPWQSCPPLEKNPVQVAPA